MDKFNEWLDEIEGYGTRRERLLEDLSSISRSDHKSLEEWLRAAWEMGAIHGGTSYNGDK